MNRIVPLQLAVRFGRYQAYSHVELMPWCFCFIITIAGKPKQNVKTHLFLSGTI